MKHQVSSMVLSPIFQGRDFKIDQGMCFVIMPLREQFLRLYAEHVKPTLQSLGLSAIKANDIFAPNVIMEDIWALVNQARIVIADVTNKNPNVFYELGIAHTVGKEVIILTQDEGDVPFDLKHLRYLKYDDNTNGWLNLRIDLANTVKEVIRDPAHEQIVQEIADFFAERDYDVQRDYPGAYNSKFDLYISKDEDYLLDVITGDGELTTEHVHAFLTKVGEADSQIYTQAEIVLVSLLPVSDNARELIKRSKIQVIYGNGTKAILSQLGNILGMYK